MEVPRILQRSLYQINDKKKLCRRDKDILRETAPQVFYVAVAPWLH